MGRKKINLELIADESTRKRTFKKRNVGLLKKVSELHTLCGVDICAIIYDNNDTPPITWPNHTDARNLVGRFMDMSEAKRKKNMLDKDDILSKTFSKLELNLEKIQKSNKFLELEDILLEKAKDEKFLMLIESKGRIDEMNCVLNDTLKWISERLSCLDGSSSVEAVVAAEERTALLKNRKEVEGCSYKQISETEDFDMIS